MSGATPDWDGFYRTERYLGAWEADGPSPELAAYLDAAGEAAGAVAVDLGCGTGHDCTLLARRGYRALGVDISAAGLEIARRHAREAGVEVEYRHGDVLDLPFEDGFADLVVDRGCYHHIPEPDRRRYAAEARRVLRPGGKLFLRGCRLDQIPFVPVTPASLRQHFRPDQWEIESVDPFPMETRSGAIEASRCVLARLP